MCFMMIRGRHRGLPYALDRAIMLPSDHINQIGSRSEEKTDSLEAATANNKQRTLPMRTYLTT
jgi:hypothetical protein